MYALTWLVSWSDCEVAGQPYVHKYARTCQDVKCMFGWSEGSKATELPITAPRLLRYP